MSDINPILQYRYVIKIIGESDMYLRAQKLSGLGFSVNLKDIETTGGIKKVPSSISYDALTLERDVRETKEEANSNLSELLDKLEVEPVNLGVYLTDATGKYVRSWTLTKVYAKSWKTSGFDATSSAVLMETITFQYDTLREIK